jgi:glycosyltransferase involved in cell wall biosynthesis
VEVRIIAPPVAMLPALHALSRTIDRRSLDWFTTSVITLAFSRELERVIPRSAQVIHHVGSAWELLGFALLRVARRRRIGFTMCPAIHPGQWGDGPLDARLLAAADLVFALSAHEMSTLERLGVAPDRVRLSPLGPATVANGNSDRFRTAHGLGTSPIVLFVGRKQIYKGYDALLEAFPLVRQDAPDSRLVTIGSGTPFTGATTGVLDLGEVDEQTKADALAACDVFCMPSSAEAFGMVYVEAWSYGKPVIVGPAPAARELVDNGQTGFHVDQVPRQIARALVKLLSDPVLAQRMGETGRRVQLERHTWQAAWRVHSEGFATAREHAALASLPLDALGARRPRA